MSYREQGLFGFGLLIIGAALFYFFTPQAVIGALVFIGFVSFCYWLSTLQQRHAKKAKEKQNTPPTWLGEIINEARNRK